MRCVLPSIVESAPPRLLDEGRTLGFHYAGPEPASPVPASPEPAGLGRSPGWLLVCYDEAEDASEALARVRDALGDAPWPGRLPEVAGLLRRSLGEEADLRLALAPDDLGGRQLVGCLARPPIASGGEATGDPSEM